ncbi:helix-turn-helix domain-containing protein [Streptomyces sp. SID8382]|uniref:helix-turn-helix transcriptional regulator n=1 Tax=Streptomyces malaysiensis TaxID=92644 RepID=UPI000C2C264A|nr:MULTISPECIES: helix-turn-helix transcriptional regulator [unclassified Streptomyces]MYX59078.1 helix-turn-helix domain-containing protein [Streptomyces sp. SID8382]
MYGPHPRTDRRTRPNPALGAFLRSRRDRLTPAQAGIHPLPGLRRVPGLRKEEVAALAGISPDHYSRLEQGRQRTLSDDLCEALARALNLTDVERKHLRSLADPGSRRGGWDRPQQPEPGLLRVMTALDHLPTLLLGRRSEVLATNALLAETLGVTLEPGTSFARWLLLDEAARARIVNWADYASAAVGALRYEVGQHPHDHALAALIKDLRAQEPHVDRWWHDQGVTDRTSVTKRIAHPTGGPLEFDVEAVTLPQCPDQQLVIYTVEPDSPTAHVLPLLRNYARQAARV